MSLGGISIRHGAYLPHWTREGSVYSITFHLADSLPKSVLQAWEFERRDIIKTAERMKRSLTPQEDRRLEKLFSERVETYLDAGAGECWMRKDDIAGVVADAIQYFDSQRYCLFAWGVMPNHVHVVAQPLAGFELPDIVHSWKSYSAKETNRLIGRTGQFWQAEPYDHLIRNEKDFYHQVEYVLSNPVRAGLKDWKWVGSKIP